MDSANNSGYIKWVSGGLLLFMSLVSDAATLSYDGNGQIIGVKNISMGTAYWNATFLSGGSYNDVLPPVYSIYANNFAQNATLKLKTVLENEFRNTPFDNDPTLTNGCSILEKCSMTTIYNVGSWSGTPKYYAHSVWNNTSTISIFASEIRPLDAVHPQITFVQWDKVTSVPLPAAAWLFGSGLLGLIGFSKRKKAA